MAKIQFSAAEKKKMLRAQMKVLRAASELVGIQPKDGLTAQVFRGWSQELISYAVTIEKLVS
jgi:nucleosome binding factor SPN SPT16 subunit